MARQALVIGLGQFGMSVAQALVRRGMEVLAVDQDVHRVDEAAAFATRVAAFDSTVEAALADAALGRRDVSVCAIGDESREASIITTALLRQLGAPLVIARATDPLHERILRLVGAHEVVNPERAFGERLAARIAFTGVIDEIPLGADLVITEVTAPSAMVGRTLAELALPTRWGVSVVAIRRQREDEASALILPRPNDPIEARDVLVLVSRPGVVEQLLARM